LGECLHVLREGQRGVHVVQHGVHIGGVPEQFPHGGTDPPPLEGNGQPSGRAHTALLAGDDYSRFIFSFSERNQTRA